MPRTPRIALVGDRSPNVQSHQRLPVVLEALAAQDQLLVDAYWIHSSEVGDLAGFDGIWLLPGSPYASEEGALHAVTQARESGIPFLGTCGGFQHALLEFARNVCGLSQTHHGESSPDGEELLIVPLACSLAGHQGTVHIGPNTRAEKLLGGTQTFERYFCSYGLNNAYLSTLKENGLIFTGHDDEGDVRIAELPSHPFFLATLFQPELADGPRAHPFIRAFAAAAANNATTKSQPVLG